MNNRNVKWVNRKNCKLVIKCDHAKLPNEY